MPPLVYRLITEIYTSWNKITTAWSSVVFKYSFYSYELNQQDANIWVNLLFLVSSTWFGLCFHPSSGALYSDDKLFTKHKQSYIKGTARFVELEQDREGSSLDKLLSKSFGYVTCSILNTVPFISEQNSLSFSTLERKDMQTAQRPACHGGTKSRATECVSDRDIEQSAKCRITKWSLETVNCRSVWDRACLHITGAALALLLPPEQSSRRCCLTSWWSTYSTRPYVGGFCNCGLQVAVRTDRLTTQLTN
jgi:hypothetical protein